MNLAQNIITLIQHLANARFGDYYAGMFHVLSAIEYILPLLGLGLLAGQLGSEKARSMLKVFFISLLGSVIIGFQLEEYQILTYLCIASFIAFGALIAFKKDIPDLIAKSLALITGMLIGLSNGAAWEKGIEPVNYSTGVLITALFIVLLFAGLVVKLSKKWQHITVRAIGSWMAAIGIMYTPFLIMN